MTLSTQLRELAAKAKLYDVTANPDHPEVLTGPYAAIDCTLGDSADENFARSKLIAELLNNLDQIADALDAGKDRPMSEQPVALKPCPAPWCQGTVVSIQHPNRYHEEGFKPCMDCFNGYCSMNCSSAPGYMKVYV